MTATKTQDQAICPRCGQEVHVFKYGAASRAFGYPIYKLGLHFADGDRCNGGDGQRVKPTPGATIERLARK